MHCLAAIFTKQILADNPNNMQHTYIGQFEDPMGFYLGFWVSGGGGVGGGGGGGGEAVWSVVYRGLGASPPRKFDILGPLRLVLI